jgi:hypothetical protein
MVAISAATYCPSGTENAPALSTCAETLKHIELLQTVES